jgi:hypothetical protein
MNRQWLSDLVPPVTLRPLAALADTPQCSEFVVRHCRRVMAGREPTQPEHEQATTIEAVGSPE